MSMHFDSLAVHAGAHPDPRTGAIQVPIFQTSTYIQDEPGCHRGYEYSRTQNPTREALEEALAGLEKGRFCRSYASGCAAATTVLHFLRQGDHVVAGDDLYGGTYRLFTTAFEPLGIRFSFVDTTDIDAIRGAWTEQTRLLWVESPSNPVLKITDLAAVSEVAKEAKALLLVDNTFATPFNQRPLDLGADLVLHSTTKYLGGHCDVVGGAVVTNDSELGERLAFYQNTLGAVPAPFDAFLTLRGIRTLSLRMQKHAVNALAIAEFLESHDRVAWVRYPFLGSHPQHQIARKQMNTGGGMVSFELRGGVEDGKTFAMATRLFALAESLGGVESLIEHPATMTHAAVPREERVRAGLTDGLIRLSVGIENVEDLINDLRGAFREVFGKA